MKPNTVGTDHAIRTFAAVEASSPLIVVRCSRKCGARIGEVFASDNGPLLHAWQAMQRRVYKVDVSAIDNIDDAAKLPGAPEDFESIAERGYVRRGLDPLPYVAFIVGGWHPPGGTACPPHGPVALDLDELLEASRRAASRGRLVTVYATNR